MHIVLVNPPVSTGVSGPPVGLSALGPFLAQRGLATRLLDLDIEFFWYVWNNWPRLQPLAQERLTKLAGNYSQDPAVFRAFHQHLRLTIPLLCRLKESLPGEPAAWDKDTASFLRHTIASLIQSYFLGGLLPAGGNLWVSMQELSLRVREMEEDRIIEDFLLRYDWRDIELAGFSLRSEFQLPYAMLFSSFLRRRIPKLRTVAGGPYVTEVAEGLGAAVETFQYFDALVVHEGESALVEIASRPTGVCNHPNVISKTRAWQPGCFLVEDIQSLPDQDFSQFCLDLYRPWGLGLPLYSSKGCTWGRCAFCSVNFLKYRERDAADFYESARQAVRRFGVQRIQLVDEDVHPARLRRFVELSQGNPDPRIEWMIQTRFYHQLDGDLIQGLARSGFATIEFGLESCDQETLKRIRKGISIPTVHRIISDCEKAGIRVILNFMVGFPWEGEDAGVESLKFVERIAKCHPRLDFQCNTQGVQVYTHSQFHQDPQRYAIKSSPAYPLSPITAWDAPVWVESFLGRHRNHALFSVRHSAANGTEYAPGPDPRVKLAERWFLLDEGSTTTPVLEWAKPLLVCASGARCQPVAVNGTLAAVIEEIEAGCTLSELRTRFVERYAAYERSQVLEVLGDALLKLNNMGALALYAN